jgi:hypothetical protein
MQMHRNMLEYLSISCVFVDLDNKYKPPVLQDYVASTYWCTA